VLGISPTVAVSMEKEGPLGWVSCHEPIFDLSIGDEVLVWIEACEQFFPNVEIGAELA